MRATVDGSYDTVGSCGAGQARSRSTSSHGGALQRVRSEPQQGMDGGLILCPTRPEDYRSPLKSALLASTEPDDDWQAPASPSRNSEGSEDRNPVGEQNDQSSTVASIATVPTLKTYLRIYQPEHVGYQARVLAAALTPSAGALACRQPSAAVAILSRAVRVVPWHDARHESLPPGPGSECALPLR